MVYVDCPTFNQSQYIKETLDGFCMQETSFPFVCGIVDDASTDGEQEVIRQYLEDNFNLEDDSVVKSDETVDYVRVFAQHKINRNCFFVVLFLKYNHYQIKKSRSLYVHEWKDAARYIAICEGDDYWIRKDKLQIQVDYLEKNSNCGLVYTRAKVFSEKTGTIEGSIGNGHCKFEEMLLHNPVPTLTVVYKLEGYLRYIDEIAPRERDWKMGDYPCRLFFAANYDVHYIDDETAVYRAKEGSASRPMDLDNKLKFLESTKNIRTFFCEKYGDEKTMSQIEQDYEESCVKAAIAYKENRQGLKILASAKSLIFSKKVRLLWAIIRN